jgi:membrane-associated phospholipid phosphatase
MSLSLLAMILILGGTLMACFLIAFGRLLDYAHPWATILISLTLSTLVLFFALFLWSQRFRKKSRRKRRTRHALPHQQ